MKYCIIGAGAAGLAAARRLKERQIPFEILEKSNEVGGIWDATSQDSPVYHSTHLISSKPLTEYPGHPMPKEYEDYPHHSKVFEYFKSFAKTVELYPHIRFNTTVLKVDRTEKGHWAVALKDGTTQEYSGVILASGFTVMPNLPVIPGNFTGETLHSKYYKSPEIFSGKRVLVIGAGNSGCDIAAEISKVAAKTYLSMRRGYHFIPKYLFGVPSDQFGELALKLRVPMKVRQKINQTLLRMVMGRPEKYGFQKPDHRILESHPIINSHILKCAAKGEVIPKADVVSYDGRRVRFQGNFEAEIDSILYATGYLPVFPYMDRKHLNWQNDHAELYLHVFHSVYDNLFVLGMLQPDSGVWGIFDAQSKAIAAYISAQQKAPVRAARFGEIKADLTEDRQLRQKYLSSLRHHFEVEHSHYLRRLKKVEKLLDF